MKYVLEYVLAGKYAVGYFLENIGMTENIKKAAHYSSVEEAKARKKELEEKKLEGIIQIVPMPEDEDYSEERFRKSLEKNQDAKRYLKPTDYGRIVESKHEHVKIQVIDIVPNVSNFFLKARYLEGKNKGEIACFHTDMVIWKR
ncbi:MAG: hypothetical protein IIT58_08345 [Treponema sp.]|nr:hypothetical protein [Treponema sp.]